MILPNDSYNETISILERALMAISIGDIDMGDQIIKCLDIASIERDRIILSNFAKSATSAPGNLVAERGSRFITPEVKCAVRLRDRYHCRFTGRRLIDTQVFKELSKLSQVFHFDEHHSVRATSRGPAGHPMVRTHGAAYEHALPHSHGYGKDIDNIILTSVELNESKGAKVLPQVPVPISLWNGLTDYLDALRRR